MTLNVHLHVCVAVFFLFSVLCQMNNFLCLPCRTAAEAMVMNPPEPTKEKEKQGFFRAIKKKKKKTQIVRLLQQTGTFLFEIWSFPLVYKVLVYKVEKFMYDDSQFYFNITGCLQHLQMMCAMMAQWLALSPFNGRSVFTVVDSNPGLFCKEMSLLLVTILGDSGSIHQSRVD